MKSACFLMTVIFLAAGADGCRRRTPQPTTPQVTAAPAIPAPGTHFPTQRGLQPGVNPSSAT